MNNVSVNFSCLVIAVKQKVIGKSILDCVVGFYRAMLCIRGTSHGPVSVRPSQVGVLLKRLNESSWFLACELPSIRPTLCLKEIRLSPKRRALPFGSLH